MPPGSHAYRCCLLAASLLLTACEKPFEPLAPTDIAFSIYGNLDASADTQWVRVMPLRESVEMLADPIDAVVTLEELETGASVVMNDSLGRYVPVFVSDSDLYAHNFWTTMPMVPGRHYRLTVTRSDGVSASAEASIPTFEDPGMELRNEFLFPGNPLDQRLRLTRGAIYGTRYLAMVLGREKVPPVCNNALEYHQQYLLMLRPAATEDDSHDVQLSWGDSRPSYVGYPPARCNLEPKEILAVAATGVWPFNPLTKLRDLSLLSSYSNIEGDGIGFLVGVHTQSFPYALCIPVERVNPCTIRYNARSATLVGRISNSCNGMPAESIVIALQSPPTNAARADTAYLSGIVEFKGLEPDVPHSLTLSQLPRGNFIPPDYAPLVVQTNEIAAGGTDIVEIELSPIWSCDLWDR